MRKPWLALFIALIAGAVTVSSQSADTPSKPVLYLVATAHLDTQWNWTVQDTIRQFIPDTFRTNFKYFEKYPDYVFTWEGAIHYMWFKEYHPDEWPTVQKYVASDRWRLAGSWINAVDTNMPSPESLMRQALYAKRFFRQEFKKASQDIYLPDCFGFGFALPSIGAHCGLKSFSTQKLTWGRPIPFPVGRWRGVDGSEILATLNPGDYVTRLQTDISTEAEWAKEFTPLGDGTSIGFRYFGTGDIGGGPTEESVQNFEKALRNPAAKFAIRNTSADQLSRDLTPQQLAALPGYTGELLLKTHGTGCYTSQAAMKRFNRVNELLGDAAERAAVAATWAAGLPYPSERLREAWIRVLWHQFHDDLTGTSIPQAYQFSWNDEFASMNQFAGVVTSSASAVAGVMDTRGDGIPLVVYNPLAMSRRDPVEAFVRLGAVAPAAVRVTDAATGRDVPAQVLAREGGNLRIVFLADVPSVGFRVFHVRPAAAGDAASSLRVTASTLENNRLSVTVDRNGDIASIYDKDARRELLRAPITLELRDNYSPAWPAWEVLYETVQAPAREYVARPEVRIIERGPVRAGLEIVRRAGGSTFVQRVRLTEGGDRVDVENDVDWRSTDSLLKASFTLAATNPKATYDLGLGTIERGNNEPDMYEVPAQKWADVTDASGTFGVGIINDSKYGWDKPTDDTLRLTLLHTPRPERGFSYQSSNDLGKHRFTYAIAGHSGDWRHGRLPARADRLNQPLVAFQADAHPGDLGRAFSMVGLDDLAGQIQIVALKRAEDSDELVVRFQERYGRPARTSVRLPAAIASAREINGAEEEVGPFALPTSRQPNAAAPRHFVLELKPYQPRTVAFRLQASAPAVAPFSSAPIALPYNLDGISTDADRSDGDFDGRNHTIAGEQLPSRLSLNGVDFTLGSSATGAKNVYVPGGETLRLPEGNFDRVYFMAASVGGDVPATVSIGGTARNLLVREWQGAIGQWDSRLAAPSALIEPFVPKGKEGTPSHKEIQQGLVVEWNPATGEVTGIEKIHPAYVKREEIAWIGTHRHQPDGNQIYVASYLFLSAVDVPAGTREIRMPSDPRLRILAASAARGPSPARPAMPLYVPDVPDLKVAR